MSFLSFSTPALALDDNALPSGSTVVGGSASLDYSTPNELHIHQSSQRVFIDWTSFNIGQNALTQFHQPGAAAMAVNRVVGGIDPTQILGALRANGTVIVLDQNGVIFGSDSVVDVGSIVVSTGDIDPGAFMNGGPALVIENIDTGGTIINEGQINVAEAGLAAFVAPTIVNNGIIQAKLGRIEMAAGTQATIDLYGDGLMELSLDQELEEAFLGNTGTISAQGGTVQVSAVVAKSVVDTVINMEGVTTVSSVTQNGGKIILEGANTEVSGTLDASGKTGGGEILVGGDYQGKGDTRTAQHTTVTSDAMIKANATDTGDGGKVIVWADQNTSFAGTIEAKGGINVGDGGFAEVSGKQNLLFAGSVDLRGENKGTLLLDPADITISGDPVAVAGPNLLRVDDLETLSITADVDVLADNTITLDLQGASLDLVNDSSLSLTTTNSDISTASSGAITTTGSATIDFDAGGDINIDHALSLTTNNARIQAGSGTISVTDTLTASNAMTFVSDDVNIAANVTANHLALRPDNDIATFGLAGGAGAYSLSAVELDLLSANSLTLGTIASTFPGYGAWNGTMNINAHTWDNDVTSRLTFRADTAMNILGVQNFNAAATHTVRYYAPNYNVTAALTANNAKELNFTGNNTTFTLGQGALATGLDDTELDLISDGWGSISVGGETTNVIVNAYSNWRDPINFYANNQLTISGAQSAAAASDASITLYGRSYSGASTPAINANIDLTNATGGGNITLTQQGPNGSTFQIADGVILTTAAGGTITIDDPVMAAGDITFKGDEIDINANLSGTGDIQLTTATTTQEIEIGSTDAGDLNLTAAELGFLQDGWNSITIGGSSHQGLIAVNETMSFSDHTTLINQTNFGAIDINASITTTDNSDLTLEALTCAGPHGCASVHIGADLNIARDFIIDRTIDLTSQTSLVSAGRDISITMSNTASLDSNFNAGRNFSLTKSGGQNTTLFTGHTIDAVGNIDFDIGGPLVLQAASRLQAGGNIAIESSRVNFDPAATISGNADGSSTLTFLEYGNDGAMEIGGTAVGSAWQMQDDELATIQDGFDKVIFGNAAMTGDISVQSINLSGLSSDFEFYGNAIDLGGVTMGTGDFLAHAQNDQDLTISANITRAVDGDATLDLRADGNIVNSNNADIIASDANSDADADSTTDPDRLNIILNADRDADSDGAVLFTNATLTTNGGNFTAGGGADPTTSMAYGNATYRAGARFHGSPITTGAGNIIIRGHGYDDIGAVSLGVDIYNGIFSTTSGNITIEGVGGAGVSNNYGIYARNTLNTQTGTISLTGTGGADQDTDGAGADTKDGAEDNYGIYFAHGAQINSTGTGAGAINITGTGGDGTQENYGIYFRGDSGTQLNVMDANVTLTGNGGDGSGDSNYGIFMSEGAKLDSSGMGTITFDGTGGNGDDNNYGVYLDDAGTEITSVDGDIDITGRGGTDGFASSFGNKGIFIDDSAVVSSTGVGANAANITLDGTGGAANYNNMGIHLENSALITTVDGDISLTGTGDTIGAASHNTNYGILLSLGSDITSTGTGAGAGTITLDGTGADGDDNNHGVYLDDNGTLITSVDGAIDITGQGGSNGLAGSDDNVGIYINGGADITSTGTGVNAATITLNGTGGAGEDGNIGVVLNTGASQISSVDGAIDITGQGGSNGQVDSISNYGISINNNADIRSTGTGVNAATITLDGTGGAGEDVNHGIYFRGSSGVITSVEGDILITGQGGTNGLVGSNTNTGMQMLGTTISSTGTGANAANITINATGADGDSSNYGLILDVSGVSSMITAIDGNIDLTGQGGDGSGSDNYGVYLTSGADITSTGTGADAGTITLDGTGGDGTDDNYGIYLYGDNTTITSVDGNISLTGQGGVTTTGNANYGIYLYSGADILSSGTNSNAATITLLGTGGDGGASEGLFIRGGTVKSGYGDISITGTKGITTNSGRGVFISNYDSGGAPEATIASTGTGDDAANITLHGTGTNNGVFLHVNGKVQTIDGDVDITGQGATGIFMRFGSGVRSTGTGAGAGTITIDGSGLNSSGVQDGVRIGQSSFVESVDGNINISGTGGNSTNSTAHGISFGDNFSSHISASGEANVTLNGEAGDCALGNCYGVYLYDATGTEHYIRTDGTGDIEITGYGGNIGDNNYGIFVEGGSTISSTMAGAGAGAIILDGTGGNGDNNNYGVYLLNAGAIVSSVDGKIDITGQGGSGSGTGNHGLSLTSDADIITTGAADIALTGVRGDAAASDILSSGTTTIVGGGAATGNITLNADTVSLSGSNIETSGNVYFLNRTSSTSIGLGGGAGTLNLSDAELAQLTLGGTLQIGKTGSTGAMIVDSVDLSAGGYALSLRGGSITVNGGLDADTSLTMIAQNAINLNGAISANGAANSVVLVGNNLVNTAGAAAIDPGVGRFLVYSNSYQTIQKGGLSAADLYGRSYNTSPPALIPGTDNTFIFADTLPVPSSNAVPGSVLNIISNYPETNETQNQSTDKSEEEKYDNQKNDMSGSNVEGCILSMGESCVINQDQI